MEYQFNNLDPVTFQRLINAILVSRFGEDVRITPLHGADGGRDAETAVGNPYFEVSLDDAQSVNNVLPPRNGREG